MGRLVKDPEQRQTGTGKHVSSFTIAVDRDFDRTQTDFIDIVAWDGTSDFVQKWFSKGKMIAVSGRLQIRDWQDKNGNRRKATEVIANSVYFGGDKKTSSTENIDEHQYETDTYTSDFEMDITPLTDDDLPF
ncbi:MAG: single-stranded DNA-binding protein [Bacteroidaceae bacterium]|nr:single-stranded DNA-binding protein [Bacteroidaceae bacterium]